MTRSKSLVARCSAIPLADGDAVPEWLHLLPAGEARTQDGRGPYRVTDAAQLIRASLNAVGKLPLDENHSTDLAAPKGEPAPARGWIVELQHRADGIWGRVDWTEAGRALVQDKAYRGISPVIMHRKDGAVTAILRASLTNTPNIIGLASLHQEEHEMDLKTLLIEALGLDGEADDDAIVAAVKAKVEGSAEEPDAAALQSAVHTAISPIAKALGLADNADAQAVLSSVTGLASGTDGRVVALQAEIVGLTGKIDTLSSNAKRKDAEAFVDGAIRAGRVGLKPVRDEYVAMHMEDPTRAEKLINAMPALNNSATSAQAPSFADEDHQDPALLSSQAAIYQRKLAEGGQQITFAAAVAAVQEGRHK